MAGETILVIDDSPTILKVVQLVLTKAGFKVTTATDGEAGLGAAREKAPDMILLDFVMPKMNGYQVCRAMAGDEHLREIPVVLMSAKGDQVGERFVKVMGIVNYITKPFSPEAITAVVQHTVGKYQHAGERPQPLLNAGDEMAAANEAQREEAAEQRRQALARVRDTLAEAVGGKVSGLFHLAQIANADAATPDARVPTDPAAISASARAALDDSTLLGAIAPARQALLEASDDEPVLSGDLRVVPIADVLQLLEAQAQSGVLNISRAGSKVDVFFREGRVDLAAAHGVSEEFLLGRFIIDLGLMGREELETFFRSRPAGQKLLGAQLVKQGYISEQELKQTIAKQSCELIYEILRWKYGRFHFRATRDLPPLAVDAALGLDVEGILMEGFRRVNEWHLIEREVENFDLVFLRNEDQVAQMGRGRLTREELAVLELVNGKNTVKDIIRASRMGSFDVSKLLYRLLSIKLIRRRVMPVAV